MKKILNIHTRTGSGRLVTTRLTESQVLKVGKMECKIVTIRSSRDDSPKRRSIHLTGWKFSSCEQRRRDNEEYIVTTSACNLRMKNVCYTHHLWSKRQNMTQSVFLACDKEGLCDVKIKFIQITKAWKGSRVHINLPYQFDTLPIELSS